MTPSHNQSRRKFFTAAGALATATCATAGTNFATATEPFPRTGGPRFRIGLAAYSLRNSFSFMKGKPKKPTDPTKAIDMPGFLDYCVEQGFEAAELTSYFFKPDADDNYFLDLKRQAFLKGVTISGTAIGNNFTRGAGDRLDQEIADAFAWIDRAAILGAPHIRFFAGTGKELDEHPERFDDAVSAMKRCADHAAKRGIFLGIENHGNLKADQLLGLIEAVDHPWVGINLDTGNFFTDDPYGDLEKCVPYAVNVQVKVSMRRPDGTHYPADLPRIGNLLKDAGYQGFVILEYEDESPYENIPVAAQQLREALM
ncbi:sugar phosphate isomerase/epimerase family protein [Rhodopirellula sp. MGV]|uniref:sugar phosphate isomerase/epimerase family protein n=1 Tax=Rhodopirellula sp. MGV TaxID=2023130 RepID=UPI000B974C6A|nr:sugar phosphate isomerase/epimerase family protein [Rhodopirellula sp. MGV]OYP34766.1 xylose isomerase [Rhodopirellula sp. MGV]PNY34370.1 sugar phosphate isomerase/epimerase [Rhodopirellula baltica]